MYFDFEGRNFDTPTVESAISWREQLLLSAFVHLALVLLVLFAPRLDFFQALQEARLERLAERARLEEAQLALLQRPEDESFVFIAPLVDVEADEPPRADAPSSDLDRVAQSPTRTLDPDVRLPVAEGNSTRLVEAAEPDEGADPLAPLELENDGPDAVEDPGPENEEPPEPVDVTNGQSETDESPTSLVDDPGPIPGELPGRERPAESTLPVPGRGPGDPDPPSPRPELRADGLLGDAMRRFQPSIRRESFGNPSGDTGKYGDIQFDSKGVDFGSWIRRFKAQVYRNWLLPYRVLTDSGRVVLTFNIHRDGTMTDLRLLRPSNVDPFNHSATNALMGSNPTQPLPVEYPDEHVFFTVTFYFNEVPPGRRF